MKRVDFMELDRGRAVILLTTSGEFFDDSDHELCYEQCLTKKGKSYKELYGFDFDSDEHYYSGIDKAIEVIQGLIRDENSNIIGFDVFEDVETKYIVWRPGKKVSGCLGLIYDYAEKHGYVTGVYTPDKKATYFLVA